MEKDDADKVSDYVAGSDKKSVKMARLLRVMIENATRAGASTSSRDVASTSRARMDLDIQTSSVAATDEEMAEENTQEQDEEPTDWFSAFRNIEIPGYVYIMGNREEAALVTEALTEDTAEREKELDGDEAKEAAVNAPSPPPPPPRDVASTSRERMDIDTQNPSVAATDEEMVQENPQEQDEEPTDWFSAFRDREIPAYVYRMGNQEEATLVTEALTKDSAELENEHDGDDAEAAVNAPSPPPPPPPPQTRTRSGRVSRPTTRMKESRAQEEEEDA